MNYLLPAEYAEFGLTAETADAWVTSASAMMEAHCRRPALTAASYTERLRLPLRSSGTGQSVRLSYTPLVSVDAVRVQYGRASTGDLCGTAPLLIEIASTFGLAGQWIAVDPATLDIDVGTGEVTFPHSGLQPRYATAEVTYTAGFSVVPTSIKVACAQIVKNAQSTPGLNVRSSKLDTLQTQYFSDSLLDAQVKALLRPYVAERLG